MPTLTYFTARLRYQAVTADEPAELGGDVDVQPQVKGINAGVNITPLIKYGDGITPYELIAQTLTPSPAMLAIAPVRARLSDGVLAITATQQDVRLVAQTAVLGLPEGAILAYEFKFDHVTFNRGEQDLPYFIVSAPTADVVLDLATAPRLKR